MSFLKNFLIYNEGNECPKDYILWAGYACLALATGRRTYLDCEHFFISPNIYVCLVGPAGNRKTFARDKAMDMLLEAIPDVIVSAECETKQGITKFLGAEEQQRLFTNHKGERVEYRPYGLFASELMNYLALDPAGMITFLTDIYDRKYYKYRLKLEEHVLINPYVVMLSCTVPEWLTRQIRSDEFCAGFGRRTIFVCDDSDIRMRPNLSDSSRQAEVLCKKRLVEVHRLVGEFKLSPAADAWFWKEWYPNHKLPQDKFLRGWARSKHIQMLKVAMLTVLSETNELVIEKNHLELALKLLDHIEDTIPMITSRMGRSEVNESAVTMLEVLKRAGGKMLEKELKMLTFKEFKNAMEQYSTMQYLQQTGQIVMVTEKVGDVDKRYVGLPQNLKKL